MLLCLLSDTVTHRISREEAEEINRIIMREVELIEVGYKSIIVGGSVP